MTAPITSQLERLFHAHDVNPAQHQGLVTDLMRLVYDERRRRWMRCWESVRCQGSGLCRADRQTSKRHVRGYTRYLP